MAAPTRGLAILVLGGALLIGGVALWLTAPRPPAPSDPASANITVPAEAGGAWSLIDQRNTRRSDRDFAGTFLLVYFGYSSCPDVCPTELAGMAAAIDALGPLGDTVTPVFITVDPARDTPAKLAKYVVTFHPRMIGLTGSDEDIAAAARAFKVYYRKAGEGADYTMDHTGFVYLVGPDGKSRSIFRSGAQPAIMAKVMRAALAKG